MLFNFPTFLNVKEQTSSDRLYNNLKILIQTHISEIWYDTEFGTNIRNHIKDSIDDIMISEIQDELIEKINKYFSNKLKIQNISIKQDFEYLHIYLTYIELQTGVYKTLQTDEIIQNNDTSFYNS